MPVDIIVGGQAGDEGKGKIASYLSHKRKYDFCVRVGGPNAGHTTIIDGKVYALKTIPSGFTNPKAKLVLGAGCYIKTDWLVEEIKFTGTADRIVIDPHAVIVEERHTLAERENARMMQEIGSVGTGLGMAVTDRINRREIKFAKDEPALKQYVGDTYELLNKALARDAQILLEGTQGIKLSNLHGEYPFVTSRDTTASTFMGEAGMGPKSVRDVFAIFKPYITRVGPGPLAKEITEDKELAWHRNEGREIGSVSKRKRRVGVFEMDFAKRAVIINSATKLAITHIDMFEGNTKAKSTDDLTAPAKAFLTSLKTLEETYPYPKLAIVSTGPDLLDIIDLEGGK